jgi:hypothetical protein
VETRSKIRNNKEDDSEADILEQINERETQSEGLDIPCGQWSEFGEGVGQEDENVNGARPQRSEKGRANLENGDTIAMILIMIQRLTTEFCEFRKDIHQEDQMITEQIREDKEYFKREVLESLNKMSREFDSRLRDKIAEVQKDTK